MLYFLYMDGPFLFRCLSVRSVALHWHRNDAFDTGSLGAVMHCTILQRELKLWGSSVDLAIIRSLLRGERFFIQNGRPKNLPKPIFSVALNIHWPDPSLMGTAKANTNNKSFDSSGAMS